MILSDAHDLLCHIDNGAKLYRWIEFDTNLDSGGRYELTSRNAGYAAVSRAVKSDLQLDWNVQSAAGTDNEYAVFIH